MKVILTGGTGLIGKSLAVELLSAGHEVVALSRSPEKARDLPPGLQIAGWDAKTGAGWVHLVEEADAIVNLAAESLRGENLLKMVFTDRWTPEKKERIRQSRLDAGAAVVDAIRQAKHRPRVVVQASAVGYYGTHGSEPIPESHPPGNDFLARVCVDWEDATAPVEALDVRRIIIRTGIILTLEGGPLPFMLIPFRLFTGGPLGSGDQVYPWIHSSDENAAIRFLLENEQAQGAYNLTAPHPVTNAEFNRTLGRVMNRPYFLPMPEFFFRLAFGEVSTVILEGQRAVPERLQQLGYQFKFPEVESALRDILGG